MSKNSRQKFQIIIILHRLTYSLAPVPQNHLQIRLLKLGEFFQLLDEKELITMTILVLTNISGILYFLYIQQGFEMYFWYFILYPMEGFFFQKAEYMAKDCFLLTKSFINRCRTKPAFYVLTLKFQFFFR